MAAQPRNERTIDSRELRGGRSLQSLLEESDVPPSALEPGPGHYFTAYSSLGNQCLGKCRSESSLTFSKTGWDEWKKVMVTKAHLKSLSCVDGPGHPYSPNNDSIELRESKRGTFGASSRPDLNSQMGAGTKGSPGPNVNLRDMAMFDLGVEQYVKGRGVKDRNSFGSSQRFSKDTKVDGGPGTHDRKDGTLRLGTGRSFGIGRNYYDKVVRPGWEKEGQGKTSRDVGPPLWMDIDKDGSRGSTIGRAERFPRQAAAEGPGPGEYRRDERDMAVNASAPRVVLPGADAATPKRYPCNCIVSDTRSPSGPKFGKPPRKPRWRTQLATNTAGRGGWGYF